MNEKCAITLHSCISVTDEVKINAQGISLGTGFEVNNNNTFLPKEIWQV